MSKLSDSDVKHVAKLANLPLTSEEISRFKSQLSKVLSYVEKLSEVDTEKVEPTSQTTGLENVLRQDEIRIEANLTQKESLSGTEKTHNGYFVVPAILERNKK